MFKSRMWGIGWNPSAPIEKHTRRFLAAVKTSRHIAKKACAPGLVSVPGRTARLKAIYLLQVAAEIEHALMAQYLYAAYSIDEQFAEGRNDELTANVNRWQRDIRTIARQEMAHLITVQNLLIALGADIYLNRENNFSLHPTEYPFPVCFEPLSLAALAKYVVTESPDPAEIASVADRVGLEEASKMVSLDLRTKVNRVGVLYMTLYWLFLPNDDSQGPWEHAPSLKPSMSRAGLLGVHLRNQDFAAVTDFEEFAATADEWGIFEPEMKVSTTDPRSRALAAIHWIMAQGEGPIGLEGEPQNAQEPSHFKRFLGMFSDFRARKADYRGAVRAVPINPVASVGRRHESGSRRNRITDPQARMWANLFDLRYQMLLIDVLLALSTSRRAVPDLRRTLVRWAVSGEMEFLRVIGRILPDLARRPGSTEKAGAPFEIIDVPLDTAKRWDLERVLMKGSAHLVRQLRKLASRERLDVLRKIEEFDACRRPCVESHSTVSRRFSWRAGKVFRDASAKGF